MIKYSEYLALVVREHYPDLENNKHEKWIVIGACTREHKKELINLRENMNDSGLVCLHSLNCMIVNLIEPYHCHVGCVLTEEDFKEL